MYWTSEYRRCHIVANRYFSGSLKEGLRVQRRIAGSRLLFTGDREFSGEFANNFFKNNENKEQLNLFLAKELIRLHENNTQELVLTFNETVFVKS